MAVTIDIADVAEKVAALQRTGTSTSVAIVVPLAEGRMEVVREFLAEGPPFDPAEIGLEGHRVFVTEREAIFVFDGAGGLQNLDRILAEREFWDVLSAWQRCAAAAPRLAGEVYSWPERTGRPAVP